MIRALLGRDVPTLAPMATLADAECVLKTGDWEAVVVARRGRLVGLVLAEDLAAARTSAATTLAIGDVSGTLARVPLKQIMRRDVPTIAPDTPVAEAARLLRDGAPPLPVLDRGRIVGLVGVADILTVLERLDAADAAT